MWFWFRLWLSARRLLPRERRDLVLENLALHHQLAVYERSHHRPDLARHDRRFWSTLARGWSGWRGSISVVQPDTVVRWHRTAWHRTAWRRYWTWKSLISLPIWGHDTLGSPNYIEAHISRLRRKLREVDAGQVIETVRGAGYRIRQPHLAPESSRDPTVEASRGFGHRGRARRRSVGAPWCRAAD